MAGLGDIFSHSTAVVFANEAPTNSISIGSRITTLIDQELETANDILRARYGVKNAIPNSSDSTRLNAQNYNLSGSASSSTLLLLILAVVLFFAFTRR